MAEYPEGKFMATVKIGPKGQIVIPKEARDMFGFQAGISFYCLPIKRRGSCCSLFRMRKRFSMRCAA